MGFKHRLVLLSSFVTVLNLCAIYPPPSTPTFGAFSYYFILHGPHLIFGYYKLPFFDLCVQLFAMFD
jgi:hypothetical protein